MSSKKSRRTYFRSLWWRFFGIATFLLVAGVIVVYAEGYQFNFNNLTWQATGAINIGGNQQGLVIKLNGVADGNSLPFNQTGLSPSSGYLVQISKSGFITWSKNFAVSAGLIATDPYVRLFPSKITAQIINNTPDVSGMCNDNLPNSSSVLTENDLGEIRSGNNLITRYSSLINDACWFPDGNHVLYSTDDQLRVIEADGTNDTLLYRSASQIIKIGVDNSGSDLYFLTADNHWYKINLQS